MKMNKNEISLSKNEFAKIQEVLQKFPDVNNFNLEQDGSSGIGYTLTMRFAYIVNEIKSMVEIEISGVENW